MSVDASAVIRAPPLSPHRRTQRSELVARGLVLRSATAVGEHHIAVPGVRVASAEHARRCQAQDSRRGVLPAQAGPFFTAVTASRACLLSALRRTAATGSTLLLLQRRARAWKKLTLGLHFTLADLEGREDVVRLRPAAGVVVIRPVASA